MLSMTRSMTSVPVPALVSLGLVGLFLIAIYSPPFFNMIFGEEYAWYEWGVAYGIAYLAAAAALGFQQNRLGAGACLVLAMAGFTTSLAGLAQAIAPGVSLQPVGVTILAVLAILHATAFVGVIGAARRWQMLATANSGHALPASILAGMGFAIGLASFGGEYAILLVGISIPWYEAIRSWLPLPHFVAAAALALGGRFAVSGSLLISIAGGLLALGMLGALVSFEYFGWELFDNVAVWLVFLLGYSVSAAFLLGFVGPTSLTRGRSRYRRSGSTAAADR